MNWRTAGNGGDPEDSVIPRDPEDRSAGDEHERREQMLDKTIADSFPTSDPPSSIPDPGEGDAFARKGHRHLLIGLAAGSWAAISLAEEKLVGTGATPEEAEQNARERGFPNVELVQVPPDSEVPMRAPDAA